MIEMAPQRGKTKALEELIANQNDGGALYVEDKDSETVKRMMEHAEKNGRSLDVHVVDFSNLPKQSSSINLETGKINRG